MAYMSNAERKWIRPNENPAVGIMKKTNTLSPYLVRFHGESL